MVISFFGIIFALPINDNTVTQIMAIKTKRHNNLKKTVKVPTSMVCAVCNCSPGLVRMYRNGKLSGEGITTLRVQVAEMILSEKLPALLQEVERILPMPTHTRKAG